jgi:hypothetical protein
MVLRRFAGLSVSSSSRFSVRKVFRARAESSSKWASVKDVDASSQSSFRIAATSDDHESGEVHKHRAN